MFWWQCAAICFGPLVCVAACLHSLLVLLLSHFVCGCGVSVPQLASFNKVSGLLLVSAGLQAILEQRQLCNPGTHLLSCGLARIIALNMAPSFCSLALPCGGSLGPSWWLVPYYSVCFCLPFACRHVSSHEKPCQCHLFNHLFSNIYLVAAACPVWPTYGCVCACSLPGMCCLQIWTFLMKQMQHTCGLAGLLGLLSLPFSRCTMQQHFCLQLRHLCSCVCLLRQMRVCLLFVACPHGLQIKWSGKACASLLCRCGQLLAASLASPMSAAFSLLCIWCVCVSQYSQPYKVGAVMGGIKAICMLEGISHFLCVFHFHTMSHLFQVAGGL